MTSNPTIFEKAIAGSADYDDLGRLVGEGGEVMDVPQMAMTGNVPYTAIRDGAFAHPTPTGSLDSLLATVD